MASPAYCKLAAQSLTDADRTAHVTCQISAECSWVLLSARARACTHARPRMGHFLPLCSRGAAHLLQQWRHCCNRLCCVFTPGTAAPFHNYECDANWELWTIHRCEFSDHMVNWDKPWMPTFDHLKALLQIHISLHIILFSLMMF